MKRLVMCTTAALMALGAPASALAASPASQCDGTYTNDRGTKTCSKPVGNSGNTKDTSVKGSFNSPHPTTYTNPGGHQPAGQQG